MEELRIEAVLWEMHAGVMTVEEGKKEIQQSFLSHLQTLKEALEQGKRIKTLDDAVSPSPQDMGFDEGIDFGIELINSKMK